MPRPKKTEAEIQAMREKILDAAQFILQEDGTEAISSRSIAEHLDMAHMSLYTYFENQTAILAALKARLLSRWLAQNKKIEERALSEGIPPLVQELLDALIVFARENPKLYKLIWLTPEHENQLPARFAQKKLVAAGLLATLLQTGMERGDYETRDPLLAASTVLGMVHTPFFLFHTGRINDPAFRDHMVDEVRSIAMDYLVKK